MTYYLFGGVIYYPQGGIDDLIDTFEDLDAAKARVLQPVEMRDHVDDDVNGERVVITKPETIEWAHIATIENGLPTIVWQWDGKHWEPVTAGWRQVTWDEWFKDEVQS